MQIRLGGLRATEEQLTTPRDLTAYPIPSLVTTDITGATATVLFVGSGQASRDGARSWLALRSQRRHERGARVFIAHSGAGGEGRCLIDLAHELQQADGHALHVEELVGLHGDVGDLLPRVARIFSDQTIQHAAGRIDGRIVGRNGAASVNRRQEFF